MLCRIKGSPYKHQQACKTSIKGRISTPITQADISLPIFKARIRTPNILPKWLLSAIILQHISYCLYFIPTTVNLHRDFHACQWNILSHQCRNLTSKKTLLLLIYLESKFGKVDCCISTTLSTGSLRFKTKNNG